MAIININISVTTKNGREQAFVVRKAKAQRWHVFMSNDTFSDGSDIASHSTVEAAVAYAVEEALMFIGKEEINANSVFGENG